MKEIKNNSRKIFFLFLLIALTIVFSTSGFQFQKNDDVFADTSTPTEGNFQAPDLKNNSTNSERLYKDLDFNATISNFDKRVYVLDQYFLQNKSPLYLSAKYFVQYCNQYNAPRDCTTVAAIAMNETHLCTYSNSAEMHNCWGFGGPGIYRKSFGSFQEGIDTVTNVLVNQYGTKYMINPSLMEKTFCGQEDNCNGWGNRIKFFMNEINNLSINLGMGDLFSLR